MSRTANILILLVAMLFVLSSCLSIPGDLDLSSYTPTATSHRPDTATPVPSAAPAAAMPSATLAIYRLGKVSLSDDASRLYVREGPGENYRAVGALYNGVIVKVFSEDVKDWDLIEFGGQLYYAASKFIVKNKALKEPDAEVYYYAATRQEHVEICTLPPAIIASNEAIAGQKIDINGDGEPDGTAIDTDGDLVAESLEYRVVDNLVDIRYSLPSVKLDLLLAGSDNPAGKALCDLPTAFLQYDAMVWLRKAQGIFLEEGYSIVLYDAYRPLTAHNKLCQAVGQPYLDASDVSPHCRGASVDIALINVETGVPLDMPCGIYEFGEAAYRGYSGMSQAERQNIRYIESVMERCGYIPNNDFWWQYDFSLYKNYMATDHDAYSMLLVRES